MNKTIAAVFGATAALGGVGVAHADAIAFASNQISNFTISSTGAFTVASATHNTVNTAQFSVPPSPAGTSNVRAFGLASDAVEGMAGPGPFPGQNNYTFLAGTNFNMLGTRSDSIQSSGSLAGGIATTNNVAEGRAISGMNQNGESAGRNTFDVGINVSRGGAFTFRFDAANDLFSSTAANPNETATARTATSIAILGTGGVVLFNFTPNGISGAEGVGVAASVDPYNLQQVCGSIGGVPVPNCSINNARNAFSATSVSIGPGQYTIAFSSLSQESVTTQARQTVPEPASILLFGAGLVGMFVARRRKHQA